MAATALMDDLDVAIAAELDRLDDKLYEVVDGERIEKPPMSVYSVLVASQLMRKLGRFADDQESGETVSEMLFRLPLKEDAYRNRRPDVAYVSFADTLDGGTVLPGFQLRLDRLFDPIVPPNEGT